jgi:hypothetical protein
MTELLLINSRVADALFKAGIQLVEMRDIGHSRAFVFNVEPGQTAIVRRILRKPNDAK